MYGTRGRDRGGWRLDVRARRVHVAAVTDVDRAHRFYEEILGLKRGSHGGSGAMVWTEYDLPSGGCIALFNGVPGTPPGGSIALEVLDLDAEIARLGGLGVSFDAAVIHSPVCRMVPLHDPDGNRLMLHQLHDQTRIMPARYGRIGKITAVAGQAQALAELLRSASAAMAGCKAYVVATDAGDADVLWVSERWVSRAHHAAALQGAAVQAAI